MPVVLSLAAVLGTAVWRDVLSRRIPNALVALGLAMGLILQAAAPAGGGLFEPVNAGALGLGSAIFGMVTGLLLFMPFYIFRMFGAGDVKLLAMIGVWIGAPGVAWVAMWTLLCGGILSLIAMLSGSHSRSVFHNLRGMFMSRSLVKNVATSEAGASSPRATTGQLPYSLAIAAGTAIEVGRQWI